MIRKAGGQARNSRFDGYLVVFRGDGRPVDQSIGVVDGECWQEIVRVAIRVSAREELLETSAKSGIGSDDSSSVDCTYIRITLIWFLGFFGAKISQKSVIWHQCITLKIRFSHYAVTQYSVFCG